MSEYQVPIAGIVLLVSTLVIITLRVREPGRSSVKEQRRHIAELERFIASQADNSLQVDWMRYKAVSKASLVDLANNRGWHLVSDDTTGRSWILKFRRDQHAAVANSRVNQPHKRLAAELVSAIPNAAGRYILDRSRYISIALPDITSAATAANWQIIESGSDDLVLARPGTSTAELNHGPFPNGEAPSTLRQSPQVLERAREIERTKGFDPLSEHNLNHARERNKAWGKQFGRQALLAFFYGFVALIMLAITFGGSIPDGTGHWISLAVTGTVIALFAVALVKARLIRRKRRAEVGGFLSAYEELNAIYRQERSGQSGADRSPAGP